MVNRPDISVVVPVFNREALIGEALSSLQRQRDVSIEIVVVDDGSTDGTLAAVRRMAAADRRIVVLSEPHRGPGAARNSGIAAACGRFLAFLDSDDLCPPGRMRRHLERLEAWPDVVGVVGALLEFTAVGATGEPLRDPVFRPHHNAALHCATFRRAAFDRLGLLDEDLPFAEDVDFFLRLLEADLQLLLESEVASFYRIHRGNMVRDLAAKQRGYLQAYARSVRRRRAAGRTVPLQSFFPRVFDRDTVFSGSSGAAP